MVTFYVNTDVLLREAKLLDEYAKSAGVLASQMAEILIAGNADVPFSRIGDAEFGTSVYQLRKETASLRKTLQESADDLYAIYHVYHDADSSAQSAYRLSASNIL